MFLFLMTALINYDQAPDASKLLTVTKSILEPSKLRSSCPTNLPLGNIFYRTKEVIESAGSLTNFESLPGDGLLAIRNLAFVEENFVLQDMEIYRNYRVERCGGTDQKYDLWKSREVLREASFDDYDTGPPATIYLMAQAATDESVGHMVQEMMLGLRHWAPLLKLYPSLLLGVRKSNEFSSWKVKELFFYALGIPSERIIELDFCSSGGYFFPQKENNLVFFPVPVYIVGKNVPEARRGWDWLEKTLLPLAGLPLRESCSSRPSGVVLVPRKPSHHLKDDHNQFDSLTPEIQDWAIKKFGAVILDVHNVSDLTYDEVALLGNARVIVNTVGSGFEFAVMIARGATFIAPNKPTPWFYNWIFYQALLSHNAEYNRYVFTTNNESDIRRALKEAMHETSLPCPIEVPDDVSFDAPL